MRNLKKRLSRIDASTWIAFVALLFSLPALVISVNEWHRHKTYDTVKEWVDIKLLTLEQMNRIEEVKLLEAAQMSTWQSGLSMVPTNLTLKQKQSIEVLNTCVTNLLTIGAKVTELNSQAFDLYLSDLETQQRLTPGKYLELSGDIRAISILRDRYIMVLMRMSNCWTQFSSSFQTNRQTSDNSMTKTNNEN